MITSVTVFPHRQWSSFPVVTVSSPAVSRVLLPMTSKADKLSLETKPIVGDNNPS